MSHPPQQNYQQYAMRPGPPGGPGQGYPHQGHGGYPPHGAPQGPPQGLGQHDPQRFYTPGPQGPQGPPQGPQGTENRTYILRNSDLTPFIDQPYQVSSPPPNFAPQHQGAPAPFYVAGSEVPSQHGQRPPQPQEHQYPPREETPHHQPGGVQSAPGETSPPPQHYTPYSQPLGGPNSPPYSQAPPGQGRPQSTYGAQELATSVYDSPIAPQHPQHNNTWSSSVHSPDDPPPQENASAPPPAGYSGPPSYQHYPPPDQQAPPVPTGQPPGPPQEGMAPPPLQPGGAAFDARQGLPSQSAPGGQQPPQYLPYVPPGANLDGPSAPPPSDYYRSGVY